MRAKQRLAQERLASVLGRRAAVRAAELAGALEISVPTLHRLLAASPLPILVAGKDAARIHRLWWYGRLIANTDMHLGNLSFQPAAGRLRLAPAYDMLPMRYAPLAGGELPTPAWTPPLPLPRERETWLTARQAALTFWGADGRGPADQRGVSRARKPPWPGVARPGRSGVTTRVESWVERAEIHEIEARPAVPSDAAQPTPSPSEVPDGAVCPVAPPPGTGGTLGRRARRSAPGRGR
jgi:hypothetical protein